MRFGPEAHHYDYSSDYDDPEVLQRMVTDEERERDRLRRERNSKHSRHTQDATRKRRNRRRQVQQRASRKANR